MASKIEKFGLVQKVEEMISSGMHTAQSISATLKKDGFDVSQPTISRWLKHVRETRSEATQQIIQDHIQKTVPADLEALEKMEAVCLSWAHEENATFAHRVAAAKIAKHFLDWLKIIKSISPEQYINPDDYKKAITEAVSEIMRSSLLWIADDMMLQKKRLSAMRQATQIIDLKLRYSGVMGAGESGNIFFLGKEDRLEEDPTTGKLMIFKGGKDAS